MGSLRIRVAAEVAALTIVPPALISLVLRSLGPYVDEVGEVVTRSMVAGSTGGVVPGIATGLVAIAVSALIILLVVRGWLKAVTALILFAWGYAAFATAVLVLGNEVIGVVTALASVLAIRFVARHFVMPVAACLGTLLGLAAPEALLGFAALLAAYDVFAVLRGPIRLVTAPAGRPILETPLAYLVYPIGNGGLGTGDILVYSAVSTMLYTRFGVPIPLSWGLAMAGLAITAVFVKWRGSAMPALPIPLTLQLSTIAGASVYTLAAELSALAASVATIVAVLSKGDK